MLSSNVPHLLENVEHLDIFTLVNWQQFHFVVAFIHSIRLLLFLTVYLQITTHTYTVTYIYSALSMRLSKNLYYEKSNTCDVLF